MAAILSDYDRANLDKILAGHGDWFSAKLMRLIMKADKENRSRLRLGFPDHVQAYENYMEVGEEESTW